MIRLLLILYAVTLVFLTLNPWFLPNSHVAIGFLTWDVIEHAIAYCGLAIILMLTFMHKESKVITTTLIIVACCLTGILLEFCQSWFTATRQLSLFDALANFFGTFLGAIAFWSLRILQSHRQ